MLNIINLYIKYVLDDFLHSFLEITMSAIKLSTDNHEFKDELGANHLCALLGFSAILEDQVERNTSYSEDFKLITKEAVNHFNITIAEFVEEFEVHPSTVSRWINGTSNPNKSARIVIIEWIYNRIEKDISDYKPNLSSINKVDERRKNKMKTIEN